ncbi:SubName: Full=Uncharacterized protein {ECO:0000313/EMBL:CCA70239.1} [Serendipita indica DSM 11827]|nr:SubName: Full=Uncharacterized protein {ECO:0000313/EMBL:CCA70239.1} [Serendipita indica DSM 11827]
MPIVIIDDTNPAIVYSQRSWRGVSGNTNNEYKSSLHYPTAVGATIRYQFRGIGIHVYGTVTQPVTKGYPNVTYQVDNDLPRGWNLSLSLQDTINTQSHVVLFKSAEYDYGDHEITVYVGDFDPGTTGRLNFDFLLVIGATEEDARNAGGLILLDDNEAGSIYDAGWSLTGGYKQEMRFGVHRSPAGATATATLPFTGTNIEVYATLDGDYGSNAIASFAVDRGTANEVVRTFNGPGRVTRQFNTRILSLLDLADGSHTLSITALGNGAVGWRLDYFIYGTPTVASSPADSGAVGDNSSNGGVSGSSASQSGGATSQTATGVIQSPIPGSDSVTLSRHINGSAGLNEQPVGESLVRGQSSKAAIAGGVIGGIAIMALAIFFLCLYRRRRKKERETASIDQYRVSVDSHGPHNSANATASSSTTPKRGDITLPVLYIPPNKAPLTIAAPAQPNLPRATTLATVQESHEAERNRVQGGSTLPLFFSTDQQGLPEATLPEEEHQGRLREQDGGIRLEWVDNEGVHETLPPSYSNYS